MISNFGVVIIFISTVLIFLIVTFLLNSFLSTSKPNAIKNSTYESGEESIGGLNSTFNPKYYVIGLAFLLFEVELILLFPWALVYNEPKIIAVTGKSWFWLAFIEVVIFVALLLIGLLYIWKNKYFEWGYSKNKVNNTIPDIYKKFNMGK